jgi:uncharacterized protein (DUF1499 family)
MIPAWLSFLDALLAVLAVLVGSLGAHFDLIAPLIGFQIFLLGFLLSVLAVLTGILGLIRTASAKRRAGLPRAITGTILGLIIAVPILMIINNVRKYPPINDITTDVDNPPEFVHATALPANRGRDMKYDRARYAALQQKGYGTVAPLKLDAPPDAVFAKVRVMAAAIPIWRVTYTNPQTKTLEGVATSRLFRFKDDFVVQVRPSGNGASLVEMRSKSRDGVGDLGTNYHRIERFFARLAATSTPSP